MAFQVLHNTNFAKEISNGLARTLEWSHPSMSIFGPCAHIFTPLVLSRIARSPLGRPSKFTDDQSSVLLNKKAFQTSNVFKTLNSRIESFKWPQILDVVPQFEVDPKHSGRFRRLKNSPSNLKLDIFFGVGLCVSADVGVRLIKKRAKRVFHFFSTQYMKVLMSSLMHEPSEKELVLQALTSPTDVLLFKISIEALADAINTLSVKYPLPRILLVVPWEEMGIIPGLVEETLQLMKEIASGAKVSLFTLQYDEESDRIDMTAATVD